MIQENIDLANDDTSYNLQEYGMTFILEVTIETPNGALHHLPEEYGRIVAFQHEIPSAETNREVYLGDEFVVGEDKIL